VILIVVVSLVAGLVTAAVNLVDRVKPGRVTAIEESLEQAFRWNPCLS